MSLDLRGTLIVGLPLTVGAVLAVGVVLIVVVGLIAGVELESIVGRPAGAPNGPVGAPSGPKAGLVGAPSDGVLNGARRGPILIGGFMVCAEATVPIAAPKPAKINAANHRDARWFEHGLVPVT